MHFTRIPSGENVIVIAYRSDGKLGKAVFGKADIVLGSVKEVELNMKEVSLKFNIFLSSLE